MADPRPRDINDPARPANPPGPDINTPPVVDTPQGTQRTEPPASAAPPNARDAQIDRTQPLARRRPVGVVLIAALLLFNLVGSLMGLFATLFGAVPAGMAMGSALYFVVMAVVLGVVLYGFWTFKPWGWVGALTVTILGTIFGLFQLIAFAEVGLLIGNLIGVIIGVLVIWYLTRPGVRALFKR